MDQEKREFYDNNGISLDEYKKIKDTAISLFKKAYICNSEDITAGINQVFKEELSKLEEDIRERHVAIKTTKGLQRRIKKSPKDNFLYNMMSSEITQYESEISIARLRISDLTDAFNLLNNYEFQDIPSWLPNSFVRQGVQRI